MTRIRLIYVGLGLGLVGAYAGLIDWGRGAFARASLGAALVGLIEVIAFLLALCIAPALIRALERGEGSASPTRLGAAPIVVAGVSSGLWLVALELIAGARSGEGAPGGSGLLTLALLGGTLGLFGGAGLALLATMARPGSHAKASVLALATERVLAARLWVLALATGAAVVLLGVLVLLRTQLLAHPWIAALLDVLGICGATALFIYLCGLRPGGWRPPRRTLGLVALGACLLVAFVGTGMRGGFLSSGVWDLLLPTLAVLAFPVVVLLVPSLPKARALVAGLSALLLLGTVWSLRALDADEDLRGAVAADWRPASWIVGAISRNTDSDGDGFSPYFGGGDCDDTRAEVYPEAIEIPGNGVDENCVGGDQPAAPPWPPRPGFVPLPDELKGTKSLLVIMVDTLRQDRLGVYGSQAGLTPNMDAFAKAGVRFERAYSAAPTTRIAVPTFLTGRSVGEISWDRSIYPFRLEDSNVTIGEVAKQAGFATASFVAHRYLGEKWNFMQGFDLIDDELAYTNATYRRKITGMDLAKKAGAWIHKHRKERFLLFAHYFDPHFAYMPQKDFPAKTGRPQDLYDGEVAYTDRAIGALLTQLETAGVADTTAVAIFSDHGELFGEHGRTTHGGVLWEETARIPMMIRAPGVAPRVVECVTAHTDIAPTLLNLAGLDGAAAGMTAATLVPELSGRPCDRSREAVLEMRHERRSGANLRALVGPRWKLVHDLRLGGHKLYDLKKKPLERRDLKKKRRKIFEAMRERLDAWAGYYSTKELRELIEKHVLASLPAAAEPVVANFENGLQLAAVDLGDRRLSTNAPIFAKLYFKKHAPLGREACKVYFHLVSKKGKVLYEEWHPPLGGAYPPRFWPRSGYVMDTFMIKRTRAWPKRGRYSFRVSLSCDGERVGLEGPRVDKVGRLKSGLLKIRGSKGKKKKKRRKKPKTKVKPLLLAP